MMSLTKIVVLCLALFSLASAEEQNYPEIATKLIKTFPNGDLKLSNVSLSGQFRIKRDKYKFNATDFVLKGLKAGLSAASGHKANKEEGPNTHDLYMHVTLGAPSVSGNVKYSKVNAEEGEAEESLATEAESSSKQWNFLIMMTIDVEKKEVMQVISLPTRGAGLKKFQTKCEGQTTELCQKLSGVVNTQRLKIWKGIRVYISSVFEGMKY